MKINAVLAFVVLVMATANAALAQVPVVAKVNIGIEGKVVYRYGGGELRARPFSSKSPVVVRIASSGADGAATLYDLRFIAVKPGRFDLRDAIERLDGVSLGDAPEAIVEVVGVLPEDHNGELTASGGLGVPRQWPYRVMLIALASLWVVPLLWVIVRRLTRKDAAAPVQAGDVPLSLADQLRPLIDAAIAGRAGVGDLSRLELLLIAHWRDRLQLRGLAAHAALQQLKAHARAGDILRSVESWLHRPRNSAESAPDVSVMLEPYRNVGRVDLSEAGVDTRGGAA